MTSKAISAGCVLILGLMATPGETAPCTETAFDGHAFTACVIDPAADDIRLWHRGADGTVYGTFDRVNAALADEGMALGVAMNGGMYHEDRSPVGHYIENGVEIMRLVTSEGPGNFGLLPNGVFCLAGSEASILETSAYASADPSCDFATQSGPMLVIDGALHPRFRADSTSRFIRNGVGVRTDGKVVMAISDEPVTFHTFARFFRDALGTPDALFIDGNVSRLHAPGLARHDFGFPMGPILGTVVPGD